MPRDPLFANGPEQLETITVAHAQYRVFLFEFSPTNVLEILLAEKYALQNGPSIRDSFQAELRRPLKGLHYLQGDPGYL